MNNPESKKRYQIRLRALIFGCELFECFHGRPAHRDFVLSRGLDNRDYVAVKGKVWEPLPDEAHSGPRVYSLELLSLLLAIADDRTKRLRIERFFRQEFEIDPSQTDMELWLNREMVAADGKVRVVRETEICSLKQPTEAAKSPKDEHILIEQNYELLSSFCVNLVVSTVNICMGFAYSRSLVLAADDYKLLNRKLAPMRKPSGQTGWDTATPDQLKQVLQSEIAHLE